MKTDLDHLPEKKQCELDRVLEILPDELEDALSGIRPPSGTRRVSLNGADSFEIAARVTVQG